MNRKTIKSPRGCIAILYTIALIVFVWAIYDKYHTGISELRKQINPAFRQAVSEELEARFERCNDVFVFKRGKDTTLVGAQPTGNPADYPIKALEKGQVLHGNFEQQVKQLHLHKNHPISADSLNTYFSKIMRRMGIKVQTKVEIKNLETQKTMVSGNDSTNLAIYPYSSETYVIDHHKRTQVQGFVDFPVEIALLHGGWPQFIRWTLFSILCILIAVLISYRKFISKRLFNQDEEDPFIRIINRKEGVYQIADIVLSTKQQAIFYKKEKMKISAQSMLLLETMILDEKHLLSKDFAYTGFKSENVLSSENNLQVAIKRLRNVLSIDPRIKIKTIRNVGYQLTAK